MQNFSNFQYYDEADFGLLDNVRNKVSEGMVRQNTAMQGLRARASNSLVSAKQQAASRLNDSKGIIIGQLNDAKTVAGNKLGDAAEKAGSYVASKAVEIGVPKLHSALKERKAGGLLSRVLKGARAGAEEGLAAVNSKGVTPNDVSGVLAATLKDTVSSGIKTPAKPSMLNSYGKSLVSGASRGAATGIVDAAPTIIRRKAEEVASRAVANSARVGNDIAGYYRENSPILKAIMRSRQS